MVALKNRGFTLIEVVLAITVGLIIIAGVSVGYSYAKRTAIIDNQCKDVAMIKTTIEQRIAGDQAYIAQAGGTLKPPDISWAGWVILSDKLPSLRTDPYTGAARFNGNQPIQCPSTGGSCIGVKTGNGWTLSDGTVSQLGYNWTKGAGSGVFNIFCVNSFTSCPIALTLADGSSKTFAGYAVFETDADGNIVAAEGGTTQNS